jgi:hypothetical protein
MKTPIFPHHALGLAGALLAMTAPHAAGQSLAPPPATRLSLADALDYASTNYPSVKVALEQKVAADRDVDVARAAYLPQVNLLWQINKATVNNITGVLLPQSVIPSISGPVRPETDRPPGTAAPACWPPGGPSISAIGQRRSPPPEKLRRRPANQWPRRALRC